MERRSSDHDSGGKEEKHRKIEKRSTDGDKGDVKWGIEVCQVGGP